MAPPNYTKQLIGSLVAAAIIVVLSIAIVTAAIGPGLDSQELHDLGIEDVYELDEGGGDGGGDEDGGGD